MEVDGRGLKKHRHSDLTFDVSVIKKKLAEDCKCGISPMGNTKIVGGVDASIEEVPWQVALVDKGDSVPFCGGSILSSKTILTAAHCCDDDDFERCKKDPKKSV